MHEENEGPWGVRGVSGLEDMEGEVVGGAVDIVLRDAGWKRERWEGIMRGCDRHVDG